MIKENLGLIRSKINEAAQRANRNPCDVRLICVTKEANASQMFDALSEGIKDLGENRVQEAALKYRGIGDKAVWHMVGHLQTNKVKEAVRIFSFIHSVDSIRLAQYIDKEAKNLGKVQDALIEVNASGEEAKFGVSAGELSDILEAVKDFKNIRINGLMTVAPLTDNPENSRGCFKILKELCNKYSLKELSMGMTQDYEVAVEEGATMVRIGRAIFS